MSKLEEQNANNQGKVNSAGFAGNEVHVYGESVVLYLLGKHSKLSLKQYKIFGKKNLTMESLY